MKGKIFTLIFVLISGLFAGQAALQAEETYVFERMWPELQQRWYFNQPKDVAVDKDWSVLVADSGYHRIQEFTRGGTFITKWGRKGSGEGQFNWPEGIATDSSGNVFVADTGNNRIQKFGPDRAFITAWGSEGSGEGQFNWPEGIATDSSGNVFVADTGNNRIQKFGPNGAFITAWGSWSYGYRDGQFDRPRGIATDTAGNIFVADTYNYRIQKFGPDGEFVTNWEVDWPFGDSLPIGIAIHESDIFHGSVINIFVVVTGYDDEYGGILRLGPDGNVMPLGYEDYEWQWRPYYFHSPSGIAIDPAGNIFVADSGNDCIHKGGAEAWSTERWTEWDQWKSGTEGSKRGQFDSPTGIAADVFGNIFVADTGNDRIQKFDPDGKFVTAWESYGLWYHFPLWEQFERPSGIATDASGNIFVADTGHEGYGLIQKFGPDGKFVRLWGDLYAEDGQFDRPRGIATDASGNIFVADSGNCRIQKLGLDGEFVKAKGECGSGEGQFESPNGIATDAVGNIFVADTGNDRIQMFGPDWEFVKAWGSEGSGDGQFNSPYGIAIDPAGNIFVADTGNDRIQVFTSEGEFMAEFGRSGFGPGLLNQPSDLCVGPNGRIYVTDSANNRIQVFRKVGTAGKLQKAVIVAGSGPGDWNNLWDATRMCADYAYGALLYQGFGRETVHYLSHDVDSEAVDAEATNANLKRAVTEWGRDAEDLFIYMVGHGGEGVFRMGATEVLHAADGPGSDDLDTWLDTVQEVIPGKVVLVYDACQSGSFLPLLTPPEGKERILAASASPSQQALFATGGKTSFSFMFWAGMFNGDSFYDSYKDAKKSVALTYLQASQIEANGNGIPNEEEDRDIARSVTVGNENMTAWDIPFIGGISSAQTLNGKPSALIYAENVIDADGVSRVWAVITPPGYSSGSPDVPATDLPILDLESVGENRYEAAYNEFTRVGDYNIAIFADDKFTAICLPKQTTVTQTKGTTLKGDINSDGELTLADALIALRAAVGSDSPGMIRGDYVSSGIDVNEDSKLGIEEVIYILQHTAELK